jgi:hypothetical protein
VADARIVGDLYPGASILGMDLSPIQPQWVPPSVKFMVDDVESPWLRPLNHFDYIHARHTVMAIRNWPQLMRRVYEYVFPPSPPSPLLMTKLQIVTSNLAAGSSSKKSTTGPSATTAACPPTTL